MQERPPTYAPIGAIIAIVASGFHLITLAYDVPPALGIGLVPGTNYTVVTLIHFLLLLGALAVLMVGFQNRSKFTTGEGFNTVDIGAYALQMNIALIVVLSLLKIVQPGSVRDVYSLFILSYAGLYSMLYLVYYHNRVYETVRDVAIAE